PPDLAVSVSPDRLWPPNHRMVNVRASVAAADACDPHPDVVLASVLSSEPADDARASPGGGGDIQGAAPGTPALDMLLRAQPDPAGAGRLYTATYLATDASGNVRAAAATVSVPHDLGHRPPDRLTLVFPVPAPDVRDVAAPRARPLVPTLVHEDGNGR